MKDRQFASCDRVYQADEKFLCRTTNKAYKCATQQKFNSDSKAEYIKTKRLSKKFDNLLCALFELLQDMFNVFLLKRFMMLQNLLVLTVYISAPIKAVRSKHRIYAGSPLTF
jgi:hypothetical protein